MSRFTTSDGLSLAWEEEGAGQPVLCLPGLTRNARDFDDLGAALAARSPARVRLIRLTFRGRGESERDPDWKNYNVAVEARDVVELLDHLGLAKATVVGTSRGGLVAMFMAAIVKDRLAGVLLNDIGPELAPEGLATIMTYLGVPPRAKEFPTVVAALKARMAAAFPDLGDDRWEVLARRWFDDVGGVPTLNYDARLRDAFEAVAAQPAVDLWPLLDALEGVPLALVRGANSDLLTAASAAEMRARRPDMIFAEVPNRGHVPFLDEPEALAALDALLARVAEGPAA
jgi:pimeloyl-ACP methyl ester carboxylesterase